MKRLIGDVRCVFSGVQVGRARAGVVILLSERLGRCLTHLAPYTVCTLTRMWFLCAICPMHPDGIGSFQSTFPVTFYSTLSKSIHQLKG